MYDIDSNTNKVKWGAMQQKSSNEIGKVECRAPLSSLCFKRESKYNLLFCADGHAENSHWLKTF